MRIKVQLYEKCASDAGVGRNSRDGFHFRVYAYVYYVRPHEKFMTAARPHLPRRAQFFLLNFAPFARNFLGDLTGRASVDGAARSWGISLSEAKFCRAFC